MTGRRIAGSVLVLLVFGLAMSWLAGSMMVAGHQAVVAQPESGAEAVLLKTDDDIRIAGVFRNGRDDRAPAVLLLHGVGASRDAMAGNARWLAGKGYATLAIDFRGHGQSEVADRSFGLNEARDARAAFEWLKQRQHGAPVAVIGMSLGGAASLIGKRGPLPADALILQAVYPDIRRAIRNRIATRLGSGMATLLEPLLSFQSRLRFGVWPSRLAPAQAISHYPGPVLVIGGQQDLYTPPSETRALFAAAPGGRELWLVPTGDHAAMGGLADATYRAKVQTFLESAIGHPSE